MKVKIRQAVEADHAFIYATYLRNRWFDKANKTTLKRSTWSAMQHNRLEKLMDSVRVACLDEDEDTILAYGLADHGAPYVYIKLAFRAPEFKLQEKLLKEIE